MDMTAAHTIEANTTFDRLAATDFICSPMCICNDQQMRHSRLEARW
jgi:hypothetical protein